MGKTKREKGELRMLACGAKERMKSGYWTKIRQEREQARERAAEEGCPAEAVDEFYKAKHTREIKANINALNNHDEELYKKVCQILEQDEDVINPVNALIDQSKYEQMDANGRQRYILTLMSKYSELKERYYKEKRFLVK